MGHEMGCRSKKGSGGEYPPLLELSQQKFTNIVPWKKCLELRHYFWETWSSTPNKRTKIRIRKISSSHATPFPTPSSSLPEIIRTYVWRFFFRPQLTFHPERRRRMWRGKEEKKKRRRLEDCRLLLLPLLPVGELTTTQKKPNRTKANLSMTP